MKSSDQDENYSAALTFLRSAARALPATITDRERIDAMYRAMMMALEYRFRFRPAEADALRRLAFRSAAGGFNPLSDHYYEVACICGGTYAALWEADRNQKAWMAHQAIGLSPDRRRHVHLTDNRIAPGMAVLLPGAAEDDELYLCRYRGRQVWWCTSLDNDTITVCRYDVVEHSEGGLRCSGSPAKRAKYSRPEWNALRARSVLADQADTLSANAEKETELVQGTTTRP